MQFQQGDDVIKKKIFDVYLSSTSRINSWDLVDVSAATIVGGWLVNPPLLKQLSQSPSLWERRIAIVATLAFIRRGDPLMTFEIADVFMNDREDLIHKATGWMLRYAIEHYSPVERQRWLLGKV